MATDVAVTTDVAVATDYYEEQGGKDEWDFSERTPKRKQKKGISWNGLKNESKNSQLMAVWDFSEWTKKKRDLLEWTKK